MLGTGLVINIDLFIVLCQMQRAMSKDAVMKASVGGFLGIWNMASSPISYVQTATKSVVKSNTINN